MSRRLGLDAVRGMMMRSFPGGIGGANSSSMAKQNHQSAVAAAAMVASPSSSPSSLWPQQRQVSQQQRRLNFTGLPPRWYKTAGVEEDGEGSFAVVLDGKRLRTPARNPLCLPTRALALAVAAEWASQSSSRVRPFTMPLMSLAATAIDEPAPREKVISTMLSYLHTDGALVREPSGTALSEEQERVFAPVVAWAERLAEEKEKKTSRVSKKSGGAGNGNEDGINRKVAFVPSDSVRGAPQSEEAVEVIREHLCSLDRWQLAAASQLAGAAKSVLLSLAALDDDDESDGSSKTRPKISLGEALVAARLEEDLQAAEWGLVEGGHDVDAAGCAVAVAAPVVFARLARLK